MKNRYYNPWHKTGQPTHFENDAPCVFEYRRFQVFNLFDKAYDYVFDNCCITQRAGASNPEKVINELLATMCTTSKAPGHTPDPPSDKHIDCEDCQGTGIGKSHEPRSCGRCHGRGYNINPHYLCPDC